MQGEHRSIRELAYKLWEARGRPAGSAEQDWLAAERQLHAESKLPANRSGAPAVSSAPAGSSASVDDSLKGTFPASDPLATQLPDEPPVNADAKWEAAGVSRDSSPRTPSGSARPQVKIKPRKPAGSSRLDAADRGTPPQHNVPPGAK
jgi:Protein of unknown function (DUF2934)